jgi:hypothetical protein
LPKCRCHTPRILRGALGTPGLKPLLSIRCPPKGCQCEDTPRPTSIRGLSRQASETVILSA